MKDYYKDDRPVRDFLEAHGKKIKDAATIGTLGLLLIGSVNFLLWGHGTLGGYTWVNVANGPIKNDNATFETGEECLIAPGQRIQILLANPFEGKLLGTISGNRHPAGTQCPNGTLFTTDLDQFRSDYPVRLPSLPPDLVDFFSDK